MSIEFEKVGSRVLIVDDDKVMASLPVDAGIIADPDKPDLVMFSNDLDAVDNESAVRVNWKKVTTPVVTDRDDLIRQLTADFFFRVAGAASADGYVLLPNSATGMSVRFGQRAGFVYAVDQELTELGFAGVENTDWVNVGGIGQE